MTSSSPAIPVRNLYYLLCYAWNYLEQAAIVDVSRAPSNNIADLFAMVLCDGIEHISRRGMQQGYQQYIEELPGIRGRVDMVGSERKFLIAHGRASCWFDDLSVDTHANRILKATVRILSSAAEDKEIVRRTHVVHAKLSSVGDVRLTKQLFRSLQLRSNERFYKFLIHVCEFVFDSWLVDSRTGAHKFRDFIRDENAMARVFEGFLFNFLRRELSSWGAAREHITWSASSDTGAALSLLPRMRTDVTLRRGSKCRIADAKYYSSATSSFFNTEKLHAANLYQLMSYLSNAHATEPGTEFSGFLIYPKVGRALREKYRIQGYSINVCTVDLSAEWYAIREEVLSIFH